MDITINTDGGSRGNPGPAAYAFVVKDGDHVIYEQKEAIGIATNNKAEYTGVMKAMEWLLMTLGPATRQPDSHPFATLMDKPFTAKGNPSVGARLVSPKGIQFILDSELVVRQLTGVYKIKDKNIMEFVKMIKECEKKLGISVTYQSVPRKENWEADALVNQALDNLVK